MTTLPVLATALAKHAASGNRSEMRALAMQVAAKIGGVRGESITSAWAREAPTCALKHWSVVAPFRVPHVPHEVESAVSRWLAELDHASAIIDAGERVRPLLLSGPTRCGKTSLAVSIGHARGMSVYRLGLAGAVGSHLGETAKKVEAALSEASSVTSPSLWLIDELDGIAFRRIADSSAAQERAHSVGAFLTMLDDLRSDFALVCTSNHRETIDTAVLGRMTAVEWPAWDLLPDDDKRMFISSHGHSNPYNAMGSASYADAVELSRFDRVGRLISEVT